MSAYKANIHTSAVLDAHSSDSIEKAAANGMERNVEQIFHGKEKQSLLNECF